MRSEFTDPQFSPRSRRTFGWAALVSVAIFSSAIAATGALIGSGALRSGPRNSAVLQAETTLYQCPMHPSIVQDHPGQCPICGMNLVKIEKPKGGSSAPGDGAPKAAEDVGMGGAASKAAGLAVVEIDPARQQLIGLKTAEATEGPVGGAWRTVGRVAVDETRVRRINLKVPGFVERIHVDFVGKHVKKGDALFCIYSPELFSAQEEYLLALRTRGALAHAAGAATGDGDALVEAAHRKLSLWDVPESQIARIAATRQPSKRITFYSPLTGVVTKKDAVEGMKLEAGATPFELVDLSSVWVLADVYESELRLVQERMAATLQLGALPNREFKGKVVFIDPILNPETRTVKVRLTFANPTGELRPEMFGEVVLQGTPHRAVRIPPDAVIDSGTEKVVFVARGEGKFEPRKIRLGESDGSYQEVTAGVEAGEEVVTRANFLIDSESRLRASLAEMSAGKTAPEPNGARP
jgi:Cu(I)/Ag(I) efflux system membrane fusion protein